MSATPAGAKPAPIALLVLPFVPAFSAHLRAANVMSAPHALQLAWGALARRRA